MSRLLSTSGLLNAGRTACAVSALCASIAIALPAQTFNTLESFDSAQGALPAATLLQAADGKLYGTTAWGGSAGYGTVFNISPSGTLTTVYSFCAASCPDASYTALVQAPDGSFYGTAGGGAKNQGTVFKITAAGSLSTLYSFCSRGGFACLDGSGPSGLTRADNGDFYGTTAVGGAHGLGTIFKITPDGVLTTIYSFCAQGEPVCADGRNPDGGLVQAAGGDFYGKTGLGGSNGDGTIFRFTPGGTLTTLHAFNGKDGAGPNVLLQAADGSLFGTTSSGGETDGGTVFKIAPNGVLTTLHSFCAAGAPNCPDGRNPTGLVQATDGNFYGTASVGGSNDYGTIFKITPAGSLTTIYSFCSQSGCADGDNPIAGLVQDTDGDFYGTTEDGGTYVTDAGYCQFGCGTIFRLSAGLNPFVETQTTSGSVGSAVKVLGTDLTGATSVSFNGTTAEFTVVSPSLITAAVPDGATTGIVQVVTPSGTLSSNAPFLVLP